MDELIPDRNSPTQGIINVCVEGPCKMEEEDDYDTLEWKCPVETDPEPGPFGWPDHPKMGSRTENSLFYLTQRFIHALQERKHTRIDLNDMAELLGVAQKRRIYDITNVLEGAGLIQKYSRNIVQWIGEEKILNPGSSRGEESVIKAALEEQKEEIFKLAEEERLLDRRIGIMKKNMREFFHGLENQQYLYESPDRILSVFPEKKIFAVRVRGGTLITTTPEKWLYTMTLYNMRIHSPSGPMEGHFLTIGGEMGNNNFCSNIPELYGRSSPPPFSTEHGKEGRTFHTFFPDPEKFSSNPETLGRPIVIPLSPLPEYQFSSLEPLSLLDLYGDDAPF